MADVTINYRSTAIATMNASGSVSLDTSGKYCDSDIEVVYEQPSGGASWTVANATRDTSYQGAVFTAPSGCTAVPAAYILYTTAAMPSVSGSPAITILKDSTHNLMWYYESGSVKVKTVSTGDFSVWYQDGKIYFDDDNTYGLASNTNVGLICVYGQAGTVTFRTKTHTPASNSTTATFATEEEPAMFVCGLDATVSLNSTHKVQTVVYSDDVNVFSGTNFYTSNIGYYTNFTESYSNSTLTLTSYSSGTSGYFNSGSQYTLYYLLSGDLSNSSNLGEKTITSNGTYNASTDGYDGYSKVVANVPNTYTNADEGKVVSNGALVAQTSDTVTTNDTYDTTLINSLTVNVSGGGSSKTLEMKNVDGSSSLWSTSALPNSLSTGGKLEVEIYCPSPNTDYDNIIGIGTTYANMQNWSTSNAMNFYLYHQAYDSIVVRQSSVSTNVSDSDIDMSIPHTITVDKDYIYVDGVQIVATSSAIVNSSELYIGANQGTKRYLGHFNSITFD